jgi:trans-2,3-dihydro-3-hydroxyanthranilate isomerase
MQAIAAEFNLAETTFVLPPQDPTNIAQVRIFTPRAELPFAGHPNIGTAFALAKESERAGRTASDPMIFEEEAGLVRLSLLTDSAAVVGARLAPPQSLSRGDDVEAESSLPPVRWPRTISPPPIIRRALRRAAFRSLLWN